MDTKLLQTNPTKIHLQLAESRYMNWRGWSLQTQLVVVVTTIILVVVFGLTTASIVRQSQKFRSELEERAKLTLISLDAATIDELYFLNVDQMETVVQNFAESSDMLAVRIYDATGRVLIATDEPLLETRLEADVFGQQLVQSRTTFLEWRSDRLVGGERIEIANQTLGAVHIELSTDDLTEQIQLSIVQGIVTAIIASGLGVLAVYFVSRSLTSPMAALVNRTQSIAKRELDKPIHVQGGSAEITELANTIEYMRKSLQEIYADLEQRVADRTVELKQARDEAVAARQVADENSRLKSEFLSTMSHELRTPMNAIEGFTSIMLNHMGGVEFNDKAERYLQKVQSNSQRLLGLINDFLDLSRIESGRLELANLPMSPAKMAQKWHDNLGVLAEKKGLAFETKVDPHLPDTMYGDEESLTKIAINLVGNAVKFTENGKVTLTLDKRDDQMALEVGDTGIGIPPHAREFIFEEFRQVDQSSKRTYGGTGLGLAIVQKLARAMGGTVTLDSEVGGGSTFTVLIPIRTEQQLA